MRILGIDPGIARIGWGVIDEEHGKVKAVAYECIETPSNEPVEKRLRLIFESVSSIFDEYNPDALAIEELFFNTNAKTAFVVGQARGVILLTAAIKQKPIAIYTPLQVKIAVTGYGRAEKTQVAQMITRTLGLRKLPKIDDTTDALAVALTHSFSRKMKSV